MSEKQFRIRLERTIRQTAEVICGGETRHEAIQRASDYANDGISWTDDPADIGIAAPFAVRILSISPPETTERRRDCRCWYCRLLIRLGLAWLVGEAALTPETKEP